MVPPPVIDPVPYVTPPRLTARSGLSLAKMLLGVVPRDAGPGVAVAAKALREVTCALDEQWKASKEAHESQDVRPLDARLTRMWSVIESSLARYAVLHGHKAKRQLAGALHEELFYEGLAFLRLGHLERHAKSAERIQLIEDDGLRDALEDLVGQEFVDELHAAHREYGEALGITEAGEGEEASASGTSAASTAVVEPLLEPMRTVQRAIGAYALQVVAFAGVDPANVPAAKQALEPIDQFWAATRRATARGDGEGGVGDGALPKGAPDPEGAVPELAEG